MDLVVRWDVSVESDAIIWINMCLYSFSGLDPKILPTWTFVAALCQASDILCFTKMWLEQLKGDETHMLDTELGLGLFTWEGGQMFHSITHQPLNQSETIVWKTWHQTGFWHFISAWRLQHASDPQTEIPFYHSQMIHNVPKPWFPSYEQIYSWQHVSDGGQEKFHLLKLDEGLQFFIVLFSELSLPFMTFFEAEIQNTISETANENVPFHVNLSHDPHVYWMKKWTHPLKPLQTKKKPNSSELTEKWLCKVTWTLKETVRDSERRMCGDAAQTKLKSELYNNTQLLSCIDVKAG